MLGGDAATILGHADAEATKLGLDADATRLGIDPGATRLGFDADATRLGLDPDATQLTPPPRPDSEVTRITPIGPDTGATRLGGPGLTEVTRLSHSPTPPPPPGAHPSGENGPLGIGEEFGRYTIVRMLGIGGMGAVYQAWDKELEVVVALKVIRPEITQDPVAEAEIERRFKRELLLARQVTHRNVVRIHDLGEIRAIKYITMSYVDGTDLATLIKRVGRLPIPKVLKIMRSVVSGLVAAHAAGVVHRDLKPANIMIDSHGEALIMDFGIARSTGGPGELPASADAHGAPPAGIKATGKYTDATVLGAIVGTIEYMAPEQARAEPVDQRADIYATGLILYDMLTGKRRAGGAVTALDELKTRMEGPPAPIKTAVPEVPEAVAALIARAVEPDAAKRFQTTTELEAALERLDENGVPKPIKRSFNVPIIAAVVALAAVAAGGAWWYSVANAPPKEQQAISIAIADLENRTGDPTFDRTLEPTLRRALEGAGFITAYDRNGIQRTLNIAIEGKLDEAATREIAVKQGLGAVLAGAIEKQGNSYSLSLKATKPVEGTVLADFSKRAASKEAVLTAATDLVASIRKKLGDTESDANPLFAKASLSASSLEVVRLYSLAMEAVTKNKFEDARTHLLKAVEIDPDFGVGYQVLAVVSRNLNQPEEAQRYIDKAISQIDHMTEREQFSTRGMLFRIQGDNAQCAKEYGAMVARFKADVIGRNQRANCEVQLRHLQSAVDEMTEVVKIIPMRAAFRVNLALYSNYNGDFETGLTQGLKVLEISGGPDPYGSVAVAMAHTAKGSFAEAAETYRAAIPLGGVAAAFAHSGLGDLSIVEGRYAEAIKTLRDAAAADAANAARAARKVVAQAYAELLRGQKAAAIAAADKALTMSQSFKIRFLAGRIFVEAGKPEKAKPLIDSLSKELQPEPQAYAKTLEALVAIHSSDPRPAVKLLTEANELLDTWIGHFDMGRAYLATKQFPQAESEFSRATKRRGEALSLFLDEEATFGYFPVVHYYLGQARQGMNMGSAAESYQAYIDLRGKASEDALLADTRRRLAALKK